MIRFPSRSECSGKGRFRPIFLARVALLAIAIVFLASLLGLAAYERLSWTVTRGHAEFAHACGRCHAASLPHRYAMAPGEWRKTVDRMADKKPDNPDLSSAAARGRIAEFLIRRRSADGALLFRMRCGRCHSRGALKPYLALEDRTLETLLRQHTAQNNFAIQKWEADLIVAHVLAGRRGRPRTLGAAAAQRQFDFQNFCGLCHDVSFLYRRMCAYAHDDAAWRQVAERMRDKAPDAIGAEKIEGLAERSSEICR
jgi:mono/diheme cytochrome c family protein